MKARLYRGPHDGRVFEVPDDQRTIKLKRKARFSFGLHTSEPGWVTIPTFDDQYEIVYLSWTRYDGSRERVPSMHPDGSVFFEWSEPRGTRIKR